MEVRVGCYLSLAVHLGEGIVLGTGEHVLGVTHAALGCLVVPAELGLVIELLHLDAAVLGRVALGAGVGRVTVGRQHSSLQVTLG